MSGNEIVGEDACGLTHHLHTGAFAVVGFGAGFGLGIGSQMLCLGCLTRFNKSKKLGTDQRATSLAELGCELLHHGIIVGFTFAIVAAGGSAIEPRQQEHAAGGSAGAAHTAYASAEAGTDTKRLLLGEAIKVCEGGTDALSAVVTLVEIANSS